MDARSRTDVGHSLTTMGLLTRRVRRMPPATESRPDFVVAETTRLLARQEASLDNIRSRAVAMLSVGALVAGLFGGHVLAARAVGWRAAVEVVALALFGVTAVLVVMTERPQDFDFGHDPTQWIDELREGRGVDATDWAYNVSRDLNKYRKHNAPKIKRLAGMYTAICFLVGLQVLAWGVASI
jgi:hypothetical protein